MKILLVILILILLFSIISTIYIYISNNLQQLNIKVIQAEAIITETLEQKYEIIKNTNKLIKEELKTRKTLLKGFEKEDIKSLNNVDLDQKLINYSKTIEEIINDHSNLINNKQIKTNQNEIKRINEKIQASKLFYNKYNSKINEAKNKFPANIIAKINHINTKDSFILPNEEDIN